MNTITFSVEPLVAERLEKVQAITHLSIDDLINVLLSGPLANIVDGDIDMLKMCAQSFDFDTREAADLVIAGYETFIAERRAAGDTCFFDDAKVRRTSAGAWQIVFRDQHPDSDNPRYR